MMDRGIYEAQLFLLEAGTLLSRARLRKMCQNEAFPHAYKLAGTLWMIPECDLIAVAKQQEVKNEANPDRP
jgi:hypothetical protein